ncbi:MAG: hypothetical protein L0229_22575 [Blastocatellia bacterium]|nr:hypothetical protein [Blastocatellia bacterium]
MSETEKTGASFFESAEGEEHPFTIPNAQEPGKVLGDMFLKRVKQPVIDKFREIRNGEGRRKGNPAAARRYLFKQAYVRFEFFDSGREIDLGDSPNETEFFVRKAEMLVDAVLIEYLNKLFPEVLDPKG